MSSIQRITPSLYQIGLGAVNVFVIKDSGLTLIDTGYPGSMPKIFKALQEMGESPDAINRVILTHAHPDHAGSAAALKQRLGVPIVAHDNEAPLLEAGVSGHAPIYPSPGIMNWLIYRYFIKGGSGRIDPVSVDERLRHGDVLPLAGGVRILHTPGHSVGHIALWLVNEGVLIAGDACAHILGLDLSIVYEDRALALRSLHSLSQLNFDKAVFGHGSPLKRQASRQFSAKFGFPNGS